MKKLLFVILFAVVSVYCHAQDVIVTIDGDRIECIIKKESDTEIKYTAWKDKKETLKTVPMSSVWSVSYDESLHKNTPIVNTQPVVPQTQSSTTTGTSTPTTTSTPMFDSVSEALVERQAYKPYTMPNQTTNTKVSNGRGKYITQSIVGYIGYFGLFLGGVLGGTAMVSEADNPWGWVVMGVGITGGIASLVWGTKSLLKIPPKSYAAVVDVPINDKLSVGLYDYALAPTQPHGAGVGLKFNF